MTGRSQPTVVGLAVVCLLALGLGTACAVELTIAGAGATNVVSGTVKLNVSAPGAEGGYVILKVDDKFISSQAPPFDFVWNSRTLEDGQHRITVTEVNADGKVADKATQVVRVENRATVTGPVTLAYQFRQGAKATYTITGQTDIKELGANRYYEFVPWNLYSSYAGRFEVAAAETVTNTQAGQAVIERALTAGEVDLPEAVSRLLGVGKTTQVNVTAAGALKDGPGVVNTECKFGAAWIALPEKPVQEGDKWSGPLVAQFEVQDGRTVAVTAEHQVVDFVKEHGVDCALIQSTYSQRGPLSVRIYGQVRELDSVFVEGQRKTYFAIKQGCVVRMEDTLRGEFTIKSGDFGMYTTGAAGPTIPGAPAPAGRSVPDTVNLQLLMSLTSDMDQ